MFTTDDEYKVITLSNGDVIDVASNNFMFMVTSYDNLDKEIIAKDNNIELGQKKKRKKITTIDELRQVFNEYMPFVLEAHCWLHPNEPLPDYLSEENIKPVVDQLIFDVLFDKYLNELYESQQTNATAYAKQMVGEHKSFSEGISKALRRQKKNFFELVNENPKLMDQVMKLGVSADEFNDRFTDQINKKPKYLFDYYYFNSYLITSNQYKRNLKKDSNYPYKRLISDLNDYNDYVNKLMPPENESPKIFFFKTMQYYFLETYKRIDYMFKIANVILKTDLKFLKKDGNIEDELRFLLERFSINIYVPYEENGRLQDGAIVKYYRPLLMIEDKMLNDIIMQKENILKISLALYNYRYIRARMYEIFKYNCEFVMPDIKKNNSQCYIKDYEYKEIKEFINQCYNLNSYHKSNEIWVTLKNIKWSKNIFDNDQELIKVFKSFFEMNDYLFPERTE